ncbi:hypothetical protein AB1Y20_013620 [Prymnesium parvum]|uniref:Uncharacterized protein n=1 Tax=Prymnesium parvum TaxID=97485 RepID=A0AB34IJ36_PRYPA|mmetsp:Transcript_14211/g.35453  ORF Transcript_14211/g.35453 Transcript_14211/m.35453 type:complete len:96 (-) Transcript_14211:200-487(-)
MALLSLLVGAALAFNAPPSLVHQSVAVNPQLSISRVSPLEMSTKYTVAAGLAKKKKPTPNGLKGYKVGDRAPDTARASGTTKSQQSLWNKMFGGK